MRNVGGIVKTILNAHFESNSTFKSASQFFRIQLFSVSSAVWQPKFNDFRATESFSPCPWSGIAFVRSLTEAFLWSKCLVRCTSVYFWFGVLCIQLQICAFVFFLFENSKWLMPPSLCSCIMTFLFVLYYHRLLWARKWPLPLLSFSLTFSCPLYPLSPRFISHTHFPSIPLPLPLSPHSVLFSIFPSPSSVKYVGISRGLSITARFLRVYCSLVGRPPRETHLGAAGILKRALKKP